MSDRATARLWLEDEEAPKRPELSLVVTRIDDEA
jgi:hypothetical protein